MIYNIVGIIETNFIFVDYSYLQIIHKLSIKSQGLFSLWVIRRHLHIDKFHSEIHSYGKIDLFKFKGQYDGVNDGLLVSFWRKNVHNTG